MEIQVWASLLGVVLGGLLSYLAQFTTVRLASKNEEKRQAAQRAEARRSEQLELLREFITITQEGIRIAEEREAGSYAFLGERFRENVVDAVHHCTEPRNRRMSGMAASKCSFRKKWLEPG